jgi:hypothetical protein
MKITVTGTGFVGLVTVGCLTIGMLRQAGLAYQGLGYHGMSKVFDSLNPWPFRTQFRALCVAKVY